MDDPKVRMYQYQHVDGTTELLFGGSNLLIALVTAAGALGINGEASATLFLLAPVGMMLLFLSALWFKERVTFPRTGRVVPRRPSSYTVGLLLLSLAGMVLPRFVGGDAYIYLGGFPLYLSAVMSVTMLLSGQGLRRFYLYAAVALAVGGGVTVAGLEPMLGALLVSGVLAGTLLVSGARVLRRYLEQHPSTDA